MAFNRPTLQQLIDRAEADLKSGLELTTILRRSFEKIISKVQAGLAHLLHGFLDFISRQILPDTADDDVVLRWATIFNVERTPANFVELIIDVTATTGGTVPDTAIYQRSDGVTYKVKDEVIIPAATTSPVTVVAEDEGATPNVDDGSTLSLTSPIAGIETDATVTSTVIEGAEQETISNLRTRVIERIQQPPSGGTVTDYIAFAKSISSTVTRVWVLPSFGELGEGTVGLTFVEDNEVSIIPSPAKVAEIQAGVTELKPVTADLITFAPTEFPIDPSIQIKPNTAAVQAAVILELEDLLLRDAQVAGASDPDQVGQSVVFSGEIPLSKLGEAISIAQGEDDHILLSPTSKVAPPLGGLAVLGTVTFSTLA